MARLLKVWEGVGCVCDTKSGAPRTSARGRAVCLAAEAEDIFAAAWGLQRGNRKARRSWWASRGGQWRGRGFTPPTWPIQPQPSRFPTRLITSSSTTSPVSWGYPQFCAEALHLGLGGWGQPDCKVGVREWEAFLLLLFARQWAVYKSVASPWLVGKRKSKGQHHGKGLLSVQDPVPISPGQSRADDQTLPTMSMPWACSGPSTKTINIH